MALIVCPECGRDVSDKAVVCPHCGYPIGQKDERGGVKVGADNDASTQNSSCEVTSNTKKKKSRVRIIVVIFAFFLIFKGVSDLLSSVKKPTNSTPTISKQEIINNAVSLEYNDLIRFSDANEGKYVIFRVRIEQIFDSFGVQYYRAYTDNDGFGAYFGDELILTDNRSKNATKIIEDDVITVYGKFVGLEKFERAIGNVKVEIPLVEMLYVDFEYEDITTSRSGENTTSQTATKEASVEQSTQTTSDETTTVSIVGNATGADGTVSKNNSEAKKQAEQYISIIAFSREGLIEQLEYEGFTHDEAVQGVDSCSVDWNNQALRKAKSYLDILAFSYSGLAEQLKIDGFTSEQAQYGVNKCGANWNEQAAIKAKSFLDLGILTFTRDELIEQLEYEGFSHDQAVYGAQQNGY